MKSEEIRDIYQRVFKMEWDRASGFSEEKAIEEAKEDKKKELKELVGIELKKLSTKPGDVVIVQLLTEAPRASLQQFLEQLRDIFIKKGHREIPIFVVPKNVEISTLSEEEMNRAGWFRREDYRRLLRPKED